MKTKFGKKYYSHPTPKWALVLQEILEYAFTAIAAGTVAVPDEWVWWKYVVAGSGFIVGGWNKVKHYFAEEENFPVDQNSPQ